jgi:phosphate transport system permease protein
MTAPALDHVGSLRAPAFGRLTVLGIGTGCALATLLLFAVTPMTGTADYIVATAVAFLVVLAAVSWAVEGPRRARDRFVTTAVTSALVLTLLPLAFVIGYTVHRGLPRLNSYFLSHSMAGVGSISAGGGIYHAIIGTLEQVLLASVISVPLGILVAIYVTEYGRNALGTAIRFLIDVMTGIPSIVAGLFVLAFWVLALHQGFSGFAASLALAVLMLPIVVRSAEEMFLLVPGALREAAYALGVPKWKTIMRIVLPTAASGLTTGVMLAIARAVGETAPVFLVAGFNNYINTNPFSGGQASLPVFIFQGARSSSDYDVDRAWAAALTLVLLVLVLYVTARLITRRNALARR